MFWLFPISPRLEINAESSECECGQWVLLADGGVCGAVIIEGGFGHRSTVPSFSLHGGLHSDGPELLIVRSSVAPPTVDFGTGVACVNIRLLPFRETIGINTAEQGRVGSFRELPWNDINICCTLVSGITSWLGQSMFCS